MVTVFAAARARPLTLVVALAALTACSSGGDATPPTAAPPTAAPTAPTAMCERDVAGADPALLTPQAALGALTGVERSTRVRDLDAAACGVAHASAAPTPATCDGPLPWAADADVAQLAASGVARVAEATYSASGTPMLRQVRLTAAPGQGTRVAAAVRAALTPCRPTVAARVDGVPSVFELRSPRQAVVRAEGDAVDVVERLAGAAPEPATLLPAIDATP